ncbi:MAG: hypothetical protein HKM07_06420 [Chlamydiae bacterium]|nr:hypothetical protein [Chlamydiota bacterium]
MSSSVVSQIQPAFIENLVANDGSISVIPHTSRISMFMMEAGKDGKNLQTYHTKIYSQPAYMNLHGGVKTQEEVADLVHSYIERRKTKDMCIGFEVYASSDGPETVRADLHTNQKFKGVVALEHGKEPGHASLFCGLKRDAWDKGIAQEAIRVIVSDYIDWARGKHYHVGSVDNTANSPLTELDAFVEKNDMQAIQALTAVGLKEDVVTGKYRHFSLRFDSKV